MRRYNIYELMNDYKDTEFDPEKGTTEFVPEKEEKADIGAVRQLVEKRVKLSCRHLKIKILAIAAAVTAAVCTGAAAFASPGDESTVWYFDMLTEKNVRIEYGYSEEYEGNYYSVDHSGETISPVELRGDRLWFVADGQEFDLTDMIDMETAYVYKTVNPVTKLADWIVIGGTPEYYMYYEFFKYGESKVTLEECNCGKEFCEHDQDYITGSVMPYLDVYVIDGVETPAYKMTDEEIAKAQEGVNKDTGEVIQIVYNAPWMESVKDEFGFSEKSLFTRGKVQWIFGDGGESRKDMKSMEDAGYWF